VAGDSGLLFDPLEETEIAAALERGLRDRTLQDSLREKGLLRARRFPWEASSEMLWKVFEGCL
jgi:glycosyltransferase involved in cell wall biosynthesis